MECRMQSAELEVNLKERPFGLSILPLNNSLSAWGLGGAHALAIAKANLAFAPTVYLFANDLYLKSFCAKVLEGVWGNFFQEVPPH